MANGGSADAKSPCNFRFRELFLAIEASDFGGLLGCGPRLGAKATHVTEIATRLTKNPAGLLLPDWNSLDRRSRAGASYWAAAALRSRAGVLAAFHERVAGRNGRQVVQPLQAMQDAKHSHTTHDQDRMNHGEHRRVRADSQRKSEHCCNRESRGLHQR